MYFFTLLFRQNNISLKQRNVVCVTQEPHLPFFVLTCRRGDATGARVRRMVEAVRPNNRTRASGRGD